MPKISTAFLLISIYLYIIKYKIQLSNDNQTYQGPASIFFWFLSSFHINVLEKIREIEFILFPKFQFAFLETQWSPAAPEWQLSKLPPCHLDYTNSNHYHPAKSSLE